MKRKVISQRKFVDPNLVGTTLTTGTTNPVGTKRVYQGTVMSTWNCNNCGHQGIPGDTKTCPNCSSTKGDTENEEYQHPADDAPYLSAPKLEEMGVDIHTHESDEQCPFCGQRLKPGTQVCTKCGGAINDPARTSRQCRSCGLATNAYTCPKCQSPTLNREDILQRDSSSESYEAPKETVYQHFSSESGFAVNWKYVGIGLLVAALIGALIFFLWPREERAMVTETNWTSTVYLQEYQYNRHSGWSIPAGGDYVSQSQEIHHYDQVPDGYETVYDTRQVCRSVYSYTQETCYDDGTCDRDAVYEDECHDETTSRQVQKYRDVPVYQTRYVYMIWEWVDITPAVLRGTGPDVRYPTDFVIDEFHRESHRGQTFSLTFTVDENTYTYAPRTLDEYLQYPQGTEWIIVRYGPVVAEIKPLPAR